MTRAAREAASVKAKRNFIFVNVIKHSSHRTLFLRASMVTAHNCKHGQPQRDGCFGCVLRALFVD
jgi:hypothetical protein